MPRGDDSLDETVEVGIDALPEMLAQRRTRVVKLVPEGT
jgi:hypothetical protein